MGVVAAVMQLGITTFKKYEEKEKDLPFHALVVGGLRQISVPGFAWSVNEEGLLSMSNKGYSMCLDVFA